MAEHGALYRKYRPQDFSEVRDQEHIVKVLEGAIKKGEIPHALLFSGTRGTGKTTMARAVARLIRPTGGAVRLDGEDVLAMNPRQLRQMRRQMQVVFQNP